MCYFDVSYTILYECEITLLNSRAAMQWQVDCPSLEHHNMQVKAYN
jgi:hypothetical protein